MLGAAVGTEDVGAEVGDVLGAGVGGNVVGELAGEVVLHGVSGHCSDEEPHGLQRSSWKPAGKLARFVLSTTPATSQLETSWQKLFASVNMEPMLVTLPTLQPDMTPLKDVAPLNM